MSTGVSKIQLHLTAVKNVGESMILCVEASQIHDRIMAIVRIQNKFLKDCPKEHSELVDFLAKKCKAIYEDREQLETYVHSVIKTIVEAEDFNYSFALPKMFIMTAFSKEKTKNPTALSNEMNGSELRDIVTLNDEGFYVFTKDFSDTVKTRSVMDPDFVLNLLKEVWVKRMSEQSSFSIIKKKIKEQLKEKDIIEEIKENMDDYLKKEKEELEESINAIQLMRSEVSKLRKE